MKNRERDKRYEFVKLCIALSKQGFQFTRYKDTYLLVFDKIELKRVLSPFTKLPFVNFICYVDNNEYKKTIDFKQWSDCKN